MALSKNEIIQEALDLASKSILENDLADVRERIDRVFMLPHTIWRSHPEDGVLDMKRNAAGVYELS